MLKNNNQNGCLNIIVAIIELIGIFVSIAWPILLLFLWASQK